MPLAARVSLRLLAAAALLAACGRADTPNAEDDSPSADTTAATDSSAAAAPAPTGAAAASDAQAPLAVDDIDRWQRGMEGELQAVHDAATKLRDAKSSTDSLSALMAANDMGTRDAGAKAAGVDPERYQRIRSTFSGIVGQMAPIEGEMNVSQMPAAAVAELKKSREQGVAQSTAGMPPELVEALRSRAADLRKQDLALTGERLKLAGMAR